jgi:hypothetical protein
MNLVLINNFLNIAFSKVASDRLNLFMIIIFVVTFIIFIKKEIFLREIFWWNKIISLLGLWLLFLIRRVRWSIKFISIFLIFQISVFLCFILVGFDWIILIFILRVFIIYWSILFIENILYILGSIIIGNFSYLI